MASLIPRSPDRSRPEGTLARRRSNSKSDFSLLSILQGDHHSGHNSPSCSSSPLHHASTGNGSSNGGASPLLHHHGHHYRRSLQDVDALGLFHHGKGIGRHCSLIGGAGTMNAASASAAATATSPVGSKHDDLRRRSTACLLPLSSPQPTTTTLPSVMSASMTATAAGGTGGQGPLLHQGSLGNGQQGRSMSIRNVLYGMWLIIGRQCILSRKSWNFQTHSSFC